MILTLLSLYNSAPKLVLVKKYFNIWKKFKMDNWHKFSSKNCLEENENFFSLGKMDNGGNGFSFLKENRPTQFIKCNVNIHMPIPDYLNSSFTNREVAVNIPRQYLLKTIKYN